MTAASMTNVTDLSAVELSRAIQSRQISCVEVMRAYLDRIERLNPLVNAIVALREPAVLLDEAAARDADLARGESRGALHGFPQAVKDLDPVRGLPFTQGSPIFRDTVADTDSILAERLRAGGAVFIGKTNTPEFGLGSQTYNPVYGTTRNAYDRSRTAGGSSGGAAVAVALGLQAVADGSDHAGSLRNPPAFNNLFGLRTSYGRIPSEGRDVFTPGLSVHGAIGRAPADIGLMLSVTAGEDPRLPYSIPEDPGRFAKPLGRDFKGTRLAWLGDCRGHLPFEPGVLELGREALGAFREIGCAVEECCPDIDFEALWRDWLVLRAWTTAANLRPLYEDPARRALMKPEAAWEVERGLNLDADQVSAAQEGRTRWHMALLRVMAPYDFFLMPSAQVFPFAADLPWPREVAGRAMDTYHRWMEVVIPVTMSGRPALNLPAGFGAEGLPTGIQLVGPHRGEFACLQLGAAYDEATRWTRRRRPELTASPA